MLRGISSSGSEGEELGGSDLVKIVECPRDAWQGLPKNMPAEVKADYLRVLIAAGFKHIDAVSLSASW
jgi:hypothetical protein